MLRPLTWLNQKVRQFRVWGWQRGGVCNGRLVSRASPILKIVWVIPASIHISHCVEELVTRTHLRKLMYKWHKNGPLVTTMWRQGYTYVQSLWTRSDIKRKHIWHLGNLKIPPKSNITKNMLVKTDMFCSIILNILFTSCF